MADVQESYPTPATYVGVPHHIKLTCSDPAYTISYKGHATLSGFKNGGSDATNSVPWIGTLFVSTLNGIPQFQLKAEPQDINNNGCNAGPITWRTDHAHPTSFSIADINGTLESYPNDDIHKYGGCTVDQNGNVTVTIPGTFLIEALCVAGTVSGGAVDGSDSTKSNVAYGQVIIFAGPFTT